MKDGPAMVVAITVWSYWLCVGVMIARVRRRTRKLAGVVPTQRLEQLMWIVWMPLVAAWATLPYLAATRGDGAWALPLPAREPLVAVLRWIPAIIAVGCLALSIECWSRMGRNWRMAVTPGERTQLITSGLYGHVRHPIYALSILLMLCTLATVPTIPVAVMAAIHVVLMYLKARNEERFLMVSHGEAYRSYCARTGRFVPRLRTDAPDDGTPL